MCIRYSFTGVALDKAHRLDTLIEEFFDITRFDFHDIVLTRGYVDLGLLLAQVTDEFYPILNEQHKEVQVDIREDLTVLVDGDKMARVFNNIMKNAIAYSYEGSTITIEARRRDGGGVRVRFINQGDPIPAAKLKAVSYTHLRAHETGRNLVCRLLLEKKKKTTVTNTLPLQHKTINKRL